MNFILPSLARRSHRSGFWLAILVLGALSVVTTTAPTFAQEKARLVNPKKKNAEQKEQPAAPAEPEATADDDAGDPNDAKANKRERRRTEKAAADQAKRELDATERAAKAERAEAARVERARAAEERAAERAARAETSKAEAKASAAASEPAAVVEAATKPKAPPPVMAAPKPGGATPLPKAAPEPARAAAPAPAVAARATPDRRSNLPARTPDVVEESIVVSEVLLDVLVTDRKGTVIHGLGPEDFSVTEEGEEVPVTSVTFYGTESELQGSGIGAEARSDRYFILLFHDQKQSASFLTAAQLDAARWTKKWIEKDLQPNDQVAVLGYDVRLKLYQDFTRDTGKIAQAVEDAALGKKEPLRIKTRSAPTFDPNSPSLFVNLPTDKTLAKESRRMQEALALLGRAAEPIVGRKNLLLYSVGYGEIDQGSFPNWTPDPRYYPDMKESLNDGNVALYAIDLQGSTRGQPGAAGINDSLSSIATDTGGHYYWNFTNHRVPLQQVTKDNLGYYLVSYQTRYPRGEKGYREVEVETKDKKHKVRARQGYRYGGS